FTRGENTKGLFVIGERSRVAPSVCGLVVGRLLYGLGVGGFGFLIFILARRLHGRRLLGTGSRFVRCRLLHRLLPLSLFRGRAVFFFARAVLRHVEAPVPFSVPGWMTHHIVSPS